MLYLFRAVEGWLDVIRVLLQGDCHQAVVSYKSSTIILVDGAMVIMSNLRDGIVGPHKCLPGPGHF